MRANKNVIFSSYDDSSVAERSNNKSVEWTEVEVQRARGQLEGMELDPDTVDIQQLGIGDSPEEW